MMNKIEDLLDRNLQDSLRAKYNPEGSKLRQLQHRLLHILMFIDRICKENNIKYWLGSGTCLGAIRHGGFIPWDDDIDIEMHYKDYKKFQRIMKHYDKGDYVFQTLNNDPHYYFVWGKVRDTHTIVNENSGYDIKYRYRGCFVDVFPVTPSNSFYISILGQRICSNIILADCSNQRFKRLCWKLIYKLSYPLFHFISGLGHRQRYRYLFGSTFTLDFDGNDFRDTVNAEFEGHSFPVPMNYKAYLTRMYGDYKQLPPNDKILTHASEFKVLDEDCKI